MGIMRFFKRPFAENLELARSVYPAASFTLTEHGIVLRTSPPPRRQKLVAPEMPARLCMEFGCRWEEFAHREIGLVTTSELRARSVPFSINAVPDLPERFVGSL